MNYGPFRELLRHFANIGPGDDDQEAEAKFVAQLPRELSEQLADILPYLLTLAGVRVSDAHTERIKYLTPEALGRQLFHAVYRLFGCLSSEQPLVLVFENWHRRDHASTDLLTHLLPLIHQSPLCICIVSRSEEPLTERGQQLVADRYSHISLSALSLDESAQLFDTLRRAHEIPSQVQVAILEKARGNPFFLEEMIFAYTQSTSTASEVQRSIPDTIESQILARVDQLPEHLKNVLRVAAVVGHSFAFAIVQDLLQVRFETLEHDLAELQRQHFINPYCAAEQAGRFKHDLLQEIIYQHIGLEHRQSLHRQVGDCMEAACTDQLDMIIPQLAYHYAQAEAWDKAKTYLLKTGDLARQVASDTEALHLYQQVLNLLDDKVENAQWVSLQRKMGEAVYWRGKHQEAEALLERALRYTGGLPSTSCWRMGMSLAKHFLHHMGCQLLPRSWRLKRSQRDLSMVTERLRLYELLVWIAYATGRPLRFLLCTLMALNLAERYGYLAEAARCFAGIGVIWDFGNAPWLAGYYHRRAVVLAERVQHPRTLALSYFCLSIHEELLGVWEQALKHHRQAARIYWEIGDLRDWGTATICLSRIYAQLGNFALSLEESEELIRVGQQGGDALVWGWGELRKGDNLMRLGVLDGAVAHLPQACTLLDSVPEYHTLAEAQGLLAQSYWKQGNVSQALAVVQDREQLTAQRGLKSSHKRFAELYLALVEHATGAEQEELFRKAKAACQAAQKSKAPHLGGRARACRLHATYAWLRGKPMTARKWWRRSLRSADRLGARWELGMTHLEMGRRLQQASHLQQAEVIFSDIGATLDAAQAREIWESIAFPERTVGSE
jgi:tetratricopeptide (TPR) repeat protein